MGGNHVSGAQLAYGAAPNIQPLAFSNKDFCTPPPQKIMSHIGNVEFMK